MERKRCPAAAFLAALWLPSVPAATITYSYDAGGHLESLAVDETGEGVHYRVDEAGSVLAVEQVGGVDLSLWGTASTSEVTLGTPVLFLVSVGNVGAVTAHDVVAAFGFDGPARVTVLASSAGSCDVARLECELGAIEGQAAVAVGILLVPRESGQWALTASALSASPDADPEDDAAVVALTVTGSGIPGDLDGDGLPDGWEVENGLDPRFAPDALDDLDHDGATSLEEFRAGTNPRFNPAVLALVRDQILAEPVRDGEGLRAVSAVVRGLILAQ